MRAHGPLHFIPGINVHRQAGALGEVGAPGRRQAGALTNSGHIRLGDAEPAAPFVRGLRQSTPPSPSGSQIKQQASTVRCTARPV
jgi:hypothetical protein